MNRCNGKCSFCPVSVGNEKREYKKMSSELFNKIIDDLVEMEYKEEVHLFFTNEPFLDDRMVEFTKIAKSKLPQAFIFISTNGSVLNLDTYKEVYKYLDLIVINNYSKDNKFKDTNKTIYDFCLSNPEYKEKTVMFMRDEDQLLSSRAGNAPNRQDTLKTIPILCFIPAVHFPIRPDGKVSLCCCDTYGEMTMGDVSKNSIKDIWNSKTYENLNKLMIKGRDKLKICKYCDYWAEAPGLLDHVYSLEDRVKNFKNMSLPLNILENNKDIN
nr:radical SAM/SPASM domain-containing protein [Brachyspira suanatina]